MPKVVGVPFGVENENTTVLLENFFVILLDEDCLGFLNIFLYTIDDGFIAFCKESITLSKLKKYLQGDFCKKNGKE